MKNRSALTTTAVLLLLLAQSAAAQRAEVGPRFGITFSTAHVDNEGGTDNADEGNVTGFALGASLRFRPGRIGLLADLMLVRKGTTVVDLSGDDDLKLQLSYLEIPVLLVVPFGSVTSASGFVYAGPALSLETGCSGKFGRNNPVDFDCDEPALDLFDRRQNDVGGMFGGGVRIPTGRGALITEARYTLGLVNLNEEDGSKVKNRSASVLLGYALTLG